MTRRFWLMGVAGTLAIGLGIVASQLPALGAGGLLYPARRTSIGPRPANCVEAAYQGVGVTLRGWQCRAAAARRGTLVYLHGIADNRSSAAGVVERFTRRGFDVIAYDSRAHGESDGDICTYGFFEKQDLSRVLDSLAPEPVVLMGTSLGGAVALQTAAADVRVSAVVAAEVFSDLRTVAAERAPLFLTSGAIDQAFRIAEERGAFRAEAVSSERAARRIQVPVLLIHGAADVDTLPDHSRRVFAALPGKKRLILVPGAAHNESLGGQIWPEIEQWIEQAVPGRRDTTR
jgi:pimeloyl-ACP methyl ester carboxylesterase